MTLDRRNVKRLKWPVHRITWRDSHHPLASVVLSLQQGPRPPALPCQRNGMRSDERRLMPPNRSKPLREALFAPVNPPLRLTAKSRFSMQKRTGALEVAVADSPQTSQVLSCRSGELLPGRILLKARWRHARAQSDVG